MARTDTDQVQRERERFFDSGCQYYIAARFSAFAGLNPVCGNQFHHAVEMFLKGYLCADFTLKKLKDRCEFGHRLDKLWSKFKSATADPALDRFDQVIDELDRFEDVRYPDQILCQGMFASIGTSRGGPTHAPGPTIKVPAYNLNVQDIDDVVEVIFEKAGVNPPFFTNRLNQDAREYLRRDNGTSVV